MHEVVTEVEVRRAKPADAPALARLERQIYREQRWFVGDGAPSEGMLAQRIRNAEPELSLWLVACSGPDLLGWLELHRFPASRLRHVATLTIAVERAARGQGVGKRLLHTSYGWARAVGVSKISLNVRAGNEAAIALYEREGFVLEGRERAQIRTAGGFEDNLIMARFLT